MLLLSKSSKSAKLALPSHMEIATLLIFTRFCPMSLVEPENFCRKKMVRRNKNRSHFF